MLRLLLLLLAAFAAAFAARLLLGRRAAPGADPGTRKSLMLKCEHCQVYVPESEAVRAGGHVYCSTAHLEHHEREQRK